jgi:hypothetical protein
MAKSAKKKPPVAPTKAPEQVREFTLILEGVEVTDDVADALYEAGCDDALFGSSDGVVFLDFNREAPSLREAVLSAIADVEKAGVGAKVIRVEPNVGNFVAAVNATLELGRRVRDPEEAKALCEALLGPRSGRSGEEGPSQSEKRKPQQNND